MPMYIKWVYPKVLMGDSHKRPIMPFCFIKIYESSVSWNIHSNNDKDREEYWEVNMAEYSKVSSIIPNLMTSSEVEIAVYGPAGKAVWIALQPTIGII